MTIRNVPADYATVADAIAAALPGDTISVAAGYSGSTVATVTVENLTFEAPASVTGLLLNFDNAILKVTLAGDANISVTGNTLGNTITGNAGDNTLDGGTGQDRYFGSAGDDTYAGGGGADKDIVDYSVESSMGATHGVIVNQSAKIVQGGVATDTVLDGFGDTDSIVGIRNIVGSNFGDKIYGGSHSNVLSGLNGRDVILGYKGDDTILGGGGGDQLTGGPGFDTLTGGGGADHFNFTKTSDGPVVSGIADKITDFSPAQGDSIDLSKIDADLTAAGNQAFTFIDTALFSHHAGELRYGPASGGGGIVILADVNGDGSADFKLNVANVASITGTDFIF